MTQKYVRHAQIGFVVWPKTDALWHAHVGELTSRRRPGGILSAGFVDFTTAGVRCFGHSESLGIGSAPDDSEALAKQLGLTAAK